MRVLMEQLIGLRPLVVPGAPVCEEESDWLDRLPVGTVLPARALARFRWPIDPLDNQHWLLVSCSTALDDEGYRRWLLALPEEGILVDPSDPRLRALLARTGKTATP